MCKYCEQLGYKVSNGERRLREVTSRKCVDFYDPSITKEIEKGVVVAYKYNPKK